MTKVVIKDCHEYDPDAVRKTINSGIELLGGWDKFIRPGMIVLLKANLLSPKPNETAVITHCEFVRAVVRELKKRGCTVWIGDSSGGALGGKAPTARSFEVSGYKKMAMEEGAELRNFDAEGVVRVKARPGLGGEMYLAKPLFEVDLVINMPKLKSHMLGVYTGAVKNLYGAVPGLKKAYYHRIAPDPGDFGGVLADINKAVKPGLHIMDAVISMDGDGPAAGDPFRSGKILISEDGLALDAVACRMIGLDISRLPMMKEPIKAGIGEWRSENIQVTGDYTQPPELKNFRVPKKFTSLRKPVYGLFSKGLELAKTRPVIDLSTCRSCNVCVDSCPVGALDRDTKAIDYNKCIECMCCHELCLYNAVRLRKANAVLNILTGIFGKRNN